MSPPSSPAPLELQLIPPDQPSSATPTPTFVHGGEAICDPAPTHEQQPGPNNGAIQEKVSTPMEADVAREGSDGSDNGTGEHCQPRQCKAQLMRDTYSRCPCHSPEEA